MAAVVSDTSPLRALDHLNLLPILPRLFGAVWLPPAVHEELVLAGVTLPNEPWLRVESPANGSLVQRLRTTLDPGEAEAIALAIEINAAIVLMDERRGRAMATSLGLQSRGVVGILIEAKAAGIIPRVASSIESLRGGLNFHLSDRIVAEALELAGESDENT